MTNRYCRHLIGASRDRHHCVLAGHLARARVQQEVGKKMTTIAALKQHYERYHAGDLTALKKIYEHHAENCVQAAKKTVDPQQHEEYLKLARQWTEAAAALQAPTK